MAEGSKFLEQPVELWPIRNEQDEKVEILPDKITAVAMNVDAKIAKTDESNYEKMIRVTSILLKEAENRSFKGAGKNISREHFHKAEVTWIKFVQTCLPDDWKTKFSV